MRKWLEGKDGKMDSKIIDIVDRKGKGRSMFKSDWETIGKRKRYSEEQEFEIYTDGSESNGKAGLGIWTKGRKDMRE